MCFQWLSGQTHQTALFAIFRSSATPLGLHARKLPASTEMALNLGYFTKMGARLLGHGSHGTTEPGSRESRRERYCTLLYTLLYTLHIPPWVHLTRLRAGSVSSAVIGLYPGE